MELRQRNGKGRGVTRGRLVLRGVTRGRLVLRVVTRGRLVVEVLGVVFTLG